MPSNPYINYYTNQAGSGISGFQGARFQKGHGFFGNVFKGAILPLLKYLGPKAVGLGAEVAKDALSGENVLESIKSRGKRTARNIASDLSDRAEKFAQTGRGRKRRRTTTTKRLKKKIVKTKTIKKKLSNKRRRIVRNQQSIFI